MYCPECSQEKESKGIGVCGPCYQSEKAIVDAAHELSIALHTLEADGSILPDYVDDAWLKFTIADQAAHGKGKDDEAVNG